jgi:hypothetical protein
VIKNIKTIREALEVKKTLYCPSFNANYIGGYREALVSLLLLSLSSWYAFLAARSIGVETVPQRKWTSELQTLSKNLWSSAIREACAVNWTLRTFYGSETNLAESGFRARIV